MASTIKVDNVQNQPGTNIINKCGTTVTVGAACNSVAVTGNVVKSNALQASDGGNIIDQCGTTVTLGASGDSIALASGATQTGFGRTGTVDWVTTVKVTGDSPITGVNGEGYFLNTTAGTITVNLPAGSAGSILAFKDYAGTWDSNAVTVAPNGSEKIAGNAGSSTLDTERQSVTLIYIDSTQGWLDIHDSTSAVEGATYVAATGGTPCSGTISGDYKIHKFTGPGTLCVSAVGNCAGSTTVDYLVVAGGGGGGTEHGGAAGAGGYRESPGTASGSYAVSPLGVSPAVALPVSVSPYAIVVGGGGAGGISPAFPGVPGADGLTSSFSTISSAGGGKGAGGNANPPGGPGGSGGGAGGNSPCHAGGTGNTPSVTPAQGTDGGTSHPGLVAGGGAGGGATVAGANASTSGADGGAGGTTSISATPTAYAGGGGGGSGPTPGGGGSGGTGGGGAGGSCEAVGTAGGCNTGGGGGGGATGYANGGNGGSGIVYIRYKFQ